MRSAWTAAGLAAILGCGSGSSGGHGGAASVAVSSLAATGTGGTGDALQAAANPARIAVGPDGWLHALEIPSPFADATPTVERWQLPVTR